MPKRKHTTKKHHKKMEKFQILNNLYVRAKTFLLKNYGLTKNHFVAFFALSKVQLRRINHFRVFNFCLKIYFVLIALIIIAIIFQICLNLYLPFMKLANEILLGNNLDKPHDLSSVFLSLSMALVGVVAIVFSIVLIPIQKAADQYSPRILESFKKDKINLAAFVLIFLFSFTLFIFSFIPPQSNFVVYQATIAIFILFSLPFILRWQYNHNISLMNPNQIILKQKKAAAKLLLTYYKLAVKFSKKYAKQQSIKKKQTMAAFFYHTNYSAILDKTKLELEEIFDITRSNFKRGKYGISQNGLWAIVDIFKAYVGIKNKSFYTTSAFIPSEYDLGSDDFLNYILEKLNDMHGLVQTDKDFEISRQVTGCLYQMALFSSGIEYMDNRLKENRICNLILGYYENCLNSAIKNGFTDISLKASDELANVGVRLIQNGYTSYLGLASVLSRIKNLASYGAYMPQYFYITSWPLKSYMTLLKALIWANPFDLHVTAKTIFSEISSIFEFYFSLNKTPTRHDESSVLAFYDILNNASFGKASADVLENLNSDQLTSKRKKEIISAVLTAAEEFSDFTLSLTRNENIPKERVARQINLNIFLLFPYFWQLYNFVETDDAHKEKIAEVFRKLLYAFESFLDAREDRMLEHNYLLEIGYGLEKYGLHELVNHVINILIRQGWKKESSEYNFHALEYAIKLTLFCKNKKKADSLIVLLEKELFPFFIDGAYHEQELGRFLYEIKKIDPIQAGFNIPSIHIDERLVAEIEPEVLNVFKSQLELIHSKIIFQQKIIKSQRNDISANIYG